MQLEYLPGGADQCPLIRLFDFTPAEIRQLQAALPVDRDANRVAVHDLPGVTSPDDARLFLLATEKERGIVATGEPRQFECMLAPESWEEIADFLQPFAKGSPGFQWLCTAGDAQWLISHDGTW